MNRTGIFEGEEYEKLMKLLGISEEEKKEDQDETDYFNAWNFGYTETDFEFTVNDSVINN